MTRYLLLFTLLISLCCTLPAQSTAGTEFWLGYMENLNLAFNDAPAFSVVINAETPTSGQVEVPATGLTIPFTAPVGTTEVFLPNAIFYSEGSESIDNKGIRITTADPVRVQAFHYRLYFAESTNLLPTTELGASYLVTTILDEGGLQPSSLVIVATEDESEIRITPSALTLGLRPAGVPFTITLDEGENYQIKSAEDLAGTEVQSLSGHPIAVFGGAQQANIIDGFCPGGADSHVWDQSLPIEDWRDLYYFVPFSGQGGDRIRILAVEDNTRVFFDCEQVATLDAGTLFESFLMAPTIVSSTAPISLTQYTNNFSCEPSQLGDPNGLSYLPAGFRATNFRWYSSDRANPSADSGRHFDRHFVTIVGPVEATANVSLDGNSVSGFLPFSANPDWAYAQVQVDGGTHELSAAESVQVYSYGFGFADSYTHHLGYTEVVPEEFVCLDIEREGVLCVDSIQQFTYQSNLDLVSFSWSFGDGGVSNDPEPTHTYAAAGTYEVSLTATDANGLQVSATLELTVIECGGDCTNLPPLTIGGATEVCADTLIWYGASSTANLLSFSWSAAAQSSNASLFPVTFDTPGIETVSLTALDANDCVYTAQLEVIVSDCPQDCSGLFIEDLAFAGDFCVDSTFSITATYTSNIDAEVVWKILGANQFIEGPVITQDAFPEEGTYELLFLVEQLGSGCFVDTIFTITVEDCPPDCSEFEILDFFVEGTPCVDSMLLFTGIFSGEPDSLSWLNNSAFGSDEQVLTVAFLQAGLQIIDLEVFWPNGCSAATSMMLDIGLCLPPPDCKVMVPNVFSPNNDGVNDEFRVFFKDACTPTDFTLEVYNRWGSLVYQTNDPNASWDGRYRGSPHPQDVLIYWCSLGYSDGQVIEKKGDVTLIR